jgi:cell division protein FtsA
VAPPTDKKLVAALDIGSSKVCAMIASIDEDQALTVLGTGQRESRGVKRGFVTDMSLSEFAVREAVELAERMAGHTVDDVWAGYGAGGLVSDIANVEVELGGHAVEQGDIEQLFEAGRNAIDRNGQVVLHAHPALYTIDRAHGVQQPIGLHANRLGVDIHIIAADPAPLRNIDTVIRSAHLGVKAIVASPIAAGRACLSDEEREMGVALVELGAEVTNVSVQLGGMLVGLRSIPLGARDITNDIACAFAVQRRDAERLKCFYGSAMTSPRDNHEMIEAQQIGAEPGQEPARITRAQLMMVIRQRIEELTGEVAGALKDLGFTGPVGRQVVLTGGGAELKNIADYMQGVLGRSVRVGRPRALPGLPDAHSGPAFSTLVGLTLLATARPVDLHDIGLVRNTQRSSGGGMLQRFWNAMRGSSAD